MTAPHPPLSSCAECGSALAPDQRYCLQCGARNGPPRVDPLRDAGVHGPARESGGAPIRDDRDAGGRSGGYAWWRRAGHASVRGDRHAWLRARGAFWMAGVAAIAAGVVLGWLSGPAPVASSAPAPSRVVLLEPAAQPVPVATPAPTAAPTPEPADTPAPTPEPTGTPEPEPTATATPDDAEPLATPTPTATETATPTPTPAATPPPIKHIWLVHVADLAAGYPAELKPQGASLTSFQPVAANPLAEAIALLSGQPPTAQTRAGCPSPSEIRNVDDSGIAKGDGCRYPAAVLTLPGQLAAAGLTWKAYVPDPSQCPAPLNAFHSLDGACPVAGLDALATDPAPELAYIAPPDDAALRALLPPLLASPAYADGGLVFLAADGPGALLLSPLVTPGATVDLATGPYSLLRTLEDAFGLVHLGHAADAGVAPLGDDVFSSPTPTPTP